MPELHDELSALRVDWPETPDLAAGVPARLEAAPTRRAASRRPWRRLPRSRLGFALVALAALAAGFAGVLAASPDTRAAVLEWLGLRSVRIERREPAARPPRPGTLGAGLGLGTPVTLDEARRRLPALARPPAAAGLGDPDATYLGAAGVALVYGNRPGFARAPDTGAALLVQRFPARVEPFIEKTLGSAARLDRLRVGGDPAFFVTGAHGFAYLPPGDVRFEEQRIAGNTLLVERADGTLLRIEGAISRDRAVAIARSTP